MSPPKTPSPVGEVAPLQPIGPIFIKKIASLELDVMCHVVLSSGESRNGEVAELGRKPAAGEKICLTPTLPYVTFS